MTAEAHARIASKTTDDPEILRQRIKDLEKRVNQQAYLLELAAKHNLELCALVELNMDDGERYRWLRSSNCQWIATHPDDTVNRRFLGLMSPEDLDAAVDAARGGLDETAGPITAGDPAEGEPAALG